MRPKKKKKESRRCRPFYFQLLLLQVSSFYSRTQKICTPPHHKVQFYFRPNTFDGEKKITKRFV